MRLPFMRLPFRNEGPEIQKGEMVVRPQKSTAEVKVKRKLVGL
jgi:hypothetical protein